MKKQTNLSQPHAGKLSLNKKTISNLSSSEMSNKIGGETGYTGYYQGCTGGNSKNCTQNQNTCPGHKTC